MKSKTLSRPMFMDVENVGIMQGFKDEDEMMDMDEGYETEAMIERMPDSPEILMNNLRGDMRSIDARTEELASLVGEEVAMETPPEILALLQPVLAAQEGIASLPAGMPPQPMGSPSSPPVEAAMPAPDMGAMPPPDIGMMPPDMGMPQGAGAMPPGPPPTAQAPINMAEGGYVQSFQAGSDEEGVTQAADMDPSSARSMLMNIRNQQVPSLQREFEEVLPVYQQALGSGDQNMSQAQMLFDIAQAGLNLAAGTDSRGQPVRPGASFASSLAAATQGLPERIADRTGQMQQQEMGTRLAALRGAEANRAAQIEAMKQDSLFGKGDWEWNIINRPGLMDRWSRGEVTEQENSLVQSALAKLGQPRTEFRPDPVTKQPVPVLVTPSLPGFVQEAMKIRSGEMSTTEAAVDTPPVEAPVDTEAEIDSTIVRNEAGEVVDFGRTVEPEPTAEEKAIETLKEGAVARDSMEPSAYSLDGDTMFNLAPLGTGVINVPKTMIAKIPLLGEFVSADEEIQARQVLDGAATQINRSIATSPRFNEGERVQIQRELDLATRMIDRPEAYRQRLIGLDTLMLTIRNRAYVQGFQSDELAPADIAAARQKVREIDQARELLGVPPRVYSLEQRNKLPKGSYYLWEGRDLAIKR